MERRIPFNIATLQRRVGKVDVGMILMTPFFVRMSAGFGQVSQLLVASVGIGSACFHCTLRHVEQQCDETPMVLSQLNWFHELFADTWEGNSFLSAAMPVLLAVYGLVRRNTPVVAQVD